MSTVHGKLPFNNFKSIEKESADALLLWSSTVASGLVELGTWSGAQTLGSRAGQLESLDSSVDSKVNSCPHSTLVPWELKAN